MPDHEPLDTLKDAQALLVMLERLMIELGKRTEGTPGVPWRGMQLTLQQTQSAIAEAMSRMAHDADEEDEIAGRLQRSKIAHRLRRVRTARG